MPVCGLPTILETILNNLIIDSNLKSYKFVGNEDTTTLVLRFAMADGSSINHSTPAKFRKKTPSQVKRDQQRRLEYLNKMPQSTADSNLHKSIELKETTMDDGQQSDSAISLF